MRNPFRRCSKTRGHPDFAVHDGGDYQHNLLHTNALPLAPPSSAPTAQSLVPVGYPPITSGYSYNNYPPTTEPPNAVPYASSQQDEKEAEGAWEFNAGNNTNKKGNQKAGNIKVGNSANGNNLPFTLPKNGRFVFNAGNNVNEGDSQEGGNVEFANVYA